MIASMLEYTRDLMLPHFDETCEAFLKLTNHPKALIQLEIIRLIPRLARRCPGVFGRRYLETCLVFLMNSAANPTPPQVGVDMRPSAFCAIGNLMLAMSSGEELIGGSLLPTVTIINKSDPKTNTKLLIQVTKTGIINQKRDELPFGLVKQALRPAKLGTSTSNICQTALHCAADLVDAFGTLADPYLSKLVNDMFTAGLSEDIFHCLHAITASVPSQQSGVVNQLLQEVSLCLAGTPNAAGICDPRSEYRVVGLPEKIVSSSDRQEYTSKVILSL